MFVQFFQKKRTKLLTNLLTRSNIAVEGRSILTFEIASYSTIIVLVVHNVNLFLFVILYNFLREFL